MVLALEQLKLHSLVLDGSENAWLDFVEVVVNVFHGLVNIDFALGEDFLLDVFLINNSDNHLASSSMALNIIDQDIIMLKLDIEVMFTKHLL